MFALERMIHILEDSSAGMVYADHYQIADGKQSNAPVIDYQFGSLRMTSTLAPAPFQHRKTKGSRRTHEV